MRLGGWAANNALESGKVKVCVYDDVTFAVKRAPGRAKAMRHLRRVGHGQATSGHPSHDPLVASLRSGPTPPRETPARPTLRCRGLLSEQEAADVTGEGGVPPLESKKVLYQKPPTCGEGVWEVRILELSIKGMPVVAKALACPAGAAEGSEAARSWWDNLAKETELCWYLGLGSGLKYHGVLVGQRDSGGRHVPLILMEKADSSVGVFLRDHREQARNPHWVVRMLRSVAKQLADLHKRRIWHLDVKPDNILYKNDGGRPTELSTRFFLSDFGIAVTGNETELGKAAGWDQGGRGGTPGYAAPEQWKRGAAPDDKADVHGLGATLFHALTGRAPIGKDHVTFDGWPDTSGGLDPILKRVQEDLVSLARVSGRARPPPPVDPRTVCRGHAHACPCHKTHQNPAHFSEAYRLAHTAAVHESTRRRPLRRRSAWTGRGGRLSMSCVIGRKRCSRDARSVGRRRA